MKKARRRILQLFITLMITALGAVPIAAQTTAFTYQGKLTDSGNPANGSYDLQFKLFLVLSGGTQQGSTQTVNSVTVTNGIFAVTLDFGTCSPSSPCFDGTARFLEIAVKPTSGGSFTTLTPRQPITSTPYALKSANSTSADGLSVACVSCVTSSQIQSVNGSAVTGTIPVAGVPAGSGNYIQNGTSQQTSSNFNISGNGTAGGTLTGSIVNAVTQVNINGLRVFTVNGAVNDGLGTVFTASNTFTGDGAGVNTTPSGTLNSLVGKLNSFYGAGAGQQNTTGFLNTFLGSQAGYANTSGLNNAFVGFAAGHENTSGFQNAFVGFAAGYFNTTGNNNAFVGYQAGYFNTAGGNAFFGAQAGYANTIGQANAFVGFAAGHENTTGNNNAFVGSAAGSSNTSGFQNAFVGSGSGGNTTTGSLNAFFGYSAGLLNTTGSGNTFIGRSADFNSTNPTGDNNTLLGAFSRVTSGISNATAIGSFASITQSNSLILGSINGVNSATADTNVGIGTTAPQGRLNVNGTSWFQGDSTPLPVTAGKGLAIGFSPPNGNGYIFAFDYATFQPQTLALNSPGGKVGIGTLSPDQTLTVNGGASKPGGGSWATFSDVRLKNITGRFTPGLRAVLQLQPIRYEYKRDNALGIHSEGEHIGFSAQEVEKVIPEAVQKNAQGYLLINNDPIIWAMLNATKELKQENDQLKQHLTEQQKEIVTLKKRVEQVEALKQLVCQMQPQADLCKAASGR